MSSFLEFLASRDMSWNEDIALIEQKESGEIVFHFADGSKCDDCKFEKNTGEHAFVTRAQWEAERARIAIQERYSQDGIAAATQSNPEIEAHIADLTAIACGKRSMEDQELWDKVAIAIAPKIIESVLSGGCVPKTLVGTWRSVAAFEMADLVSEVMAERAKRMKG